MYIRKYAVGHYLAYLQTFPIQKSDHWMKPGFFLLTFSSNVWTE